MKNEDQLYRWKRSPIESIDFHWKFRNWDFFPIKTVGSHFSWAIVRSLCSERCRHRAANLYSHREQGMEVGRFWHFASHAPYGSKTHSHAQPETSLNPSCGVPLSWVLQRVPRTATNVLQPGSPFSVVHMDNDQRLFPVGSYHPNASVTRRFFLRFIHTTFVDDTSLCCLVLRHVFYYFILIISGSCFVEQKIWKDQNLCFVLNVDSLASWIEVFLPNRFLILILSYGYCPVLDLSLSPCLRTTFILRFLPLFRV